MEYKTMRDLDARLDAVLEAYDTLCDKVTVMKKLAERVRAFEGGPLEASEQEYKKRLSAARNDDRIQELEEIIASQPKARLKKIKNQRFTGYTADTELRELQESAVRITPEEIELDKLRRQRVSLSAGEIAELRAVFEPLSNEAEKETREIINLLDSLCDETGKLAREAEEVSQHRQASFAFVNASGISSRISHLENGEKVFLELTPAQRAAGFRA